MSVADGGERSKQVLEAKVLDALGDYFEAQRREIEDSKKRAGSGFAEYEEARRLVAEAEEQLGEVRRAMAELQAEAVDTIVCGDKVSELERGL